MAETLFRTVVLYLCVVIVMRIMGKRQVGELQPNELVVTILISELAAMPMQNLDTPMLGGIAAIAVLVALEILLSLLTLGSFRARKLVDGSPALIIRKGVIDQKKMKQVRFTVEDLLENMRQQGIFRLEDVDYAIVETNGRLSFLQVAQSRPLTAGQFGAPAPDAGLCPALLISDGRLIPQGFEISGIDEGRLHKELDDRQLTVKGVYLMTADQAGNFTVVRK